MKAALDDMLHAPVRLQIGAFLLRADEAEFAVLRELAEVSDSVLSKHLSALSEAGYVSLRKAAREGRQRTWVAFTANGRNAFRGHLKALQAMMTAAEAQSND
ncbi:transcriptional regulator [Sphingomonas kaistensis]|uniref:Transcriptional regulator n=1 Tax=Sphingomonas kaistensis TaxID=298708 RepID=A0ABZ2FXJ1_9SPHN